MELRNKSDYGKFTANSNIGKIRFEFDICGFGEKIRVYQNGQLMFYGESLYDVDVEIDNNEKTIEATSEDGYIEIYKDSIRRTNKPLNNKYKEG